MQAAVLQTRFVSFVRRQGQIRVPSDGHGRALEEQPTPLLRATRPAQRRVPHRRTQQRRADVRAVQ